MSLGLNAMFRLARSSGFVLILTAGLMLGASCCRGPSAAPPQFLETPASLLFAAPYVAQEIAIRNPAPQPTRIVIDEESVVGWLSPPEKTLRFPVELRDGARLSFRLGVASEKPPERGILAATIEFTPLGDSGRRAGPSREIQKMEIDAGSVDLNRWFDLDMDLDPAGSGKGELRFLMDGALASNRDVRILWGSPTIYYPSERRHRNVLVIGVDTLRKDALSVYGGRAEVTPNLERLSSEGTVFIRAWSQAPWTVPSFASMLTGVYPADLGPTFATDQLPESATTLGEILLPAGFATSVICGNAYLGNDASGFHQGMEGLWYRLSATPSDSVEKAMDFIARSKDRDWFLFLHYMDPHGPYDPPQEYIDKLCDPGYSGKYQTAFEDGREWQLVTSIPPAEDVRRARCLYDAEVADLDASIGSLFTFLDESGLLDDTLIVLAADHGEEFFEHGQFEHGQSLYEEQVHLPLIVWGPGFSRGRRLDASVGNIDIAPTILTYLDMPVGEGLRGIPLQDIVSGSADEERIIFGEGNLRRSSHRKFAVEWPYKCVLDFFTDEMRLYDLASDPMEMNDISAAHPETARRLAWEMVKAMLPTQTTFALTMLGDPAGGPTRFSGTIDVPGGVAYVKDSGFLEGDEFSTEGTEIAFDFSTAIDPEEPLKSLIVIPAPGGDTIEVTVLADGRVDPDRFFPYASSDPESTGSARVRVYDLPWPNRIPANALELPVACYILGLPGYPRDGETEFEHRELDPETLEQLRALGYIN